MLSATSLHSSTLFFVSPSGDHFEPTHLYLIKYTTVLLANMIVSNYLRDKVSRIHELYRVNFTTLLRGKCFHKTSFQEMKHTRRV